ASAFKTESESLEFPPTLLPESPTLDNFINLFTELNFDVYLVNTVIIVVASMFGMFLSTMAGYGFAKFNFKGKEFLFYMILATMMIPNQVTMIPVFLIVNFLGLTNTMAGIILPGLIVAFMIFLIRQFM